jgi:sRNA-binding protein
MLTDDQVQQAQARNKHYKLADQGGLYLYVSPKGGRSWRYDYYLHEKRETVTFGQYPDFSLAEARELHAKARQLVARGESPAKAKQAEKRAAKEAARAARAAEMRNPAQLAKLDKDIPKAIQAVSGKRISEATLGDLLAIATCVKDMWFGERSGAPSEGEK